MLHMLRWLYPRLQSYVPNVSSATNMLQKVLSCCKCLSRRKRSPCARYGCCESRSRCHIYCNGYTRMLQVSIQNVSSTSDVCCKWFYLDIEYICNMLQWLYTYVASICCKHMFQMFHLLYTYVIESAFILHMFHKQAQAPRVWYVCCKCIGQYKWHPVYETYIASVQYNTSGSAPAGK
jgi:hypothetical protein